MEGQFLVTELAVLFEQRAAQHGLCRQALPPGFLNPVPAQIPRHQAQKIAILVQPLRHGFQFTADLVFGELYRLRQPEALLREFDMYEACGEGFAEPTEYIRQMLPVTPRDEAVREAWTYIYNWPVAGLPRIASGRFLEK